MICPNCQSPNRPEAKFCDNCGYRLAAEDGSKSELVHQLMYLEHVDLIREAAREPELEYLFRHVFVQDAVYHSLLQRERSELHRAAGQALEELFPERSAQLAAMLAKHFDEAGEDAKAFEYYSLAGKQAQSQYANAEAIQLFDRAIALGKRLAIQSEGQRLIEVYLMLGRTCELYGAYPRALEVYKDMQAEGERRGDDRMLLQALVAQATIHVAPSDVFNPEQGAALSERALKLAEQLDEPEAEAKIYWNLLLLHLFTSDLGKAIEYGEKSLEIARRHALKERLAYASHDVSRAYTASGDFTTGLQRLGQAQELWRELNNLPMLTDSLSSAALYHMVNGEYDQVIALTEEAYQLSESINNLWGQSFALYSRVFVHFILGEYDKALEASHECMRLAEPAGFVVPLVECPYFIAIMYLDMGDVAQAAEWAERSSVNALKLLPSDVPGALGVKALVHVQRGELEQAAQLLSSEQPGGGPIPQENFFVFQAWERLEFARHNYEGVLDLTNKISLSLGEFNFEVLSKYPHYVKGKAQEALGRLDEAHESLRSALLTTEKYKVRPFLWAILGALARVEERRGNPEEARALRARAKEVIAFMADHAPTPELRTSFLNRPDVKDALG